MQGVGAPVYTGNRGMGFEYALEHTNRMYEAMELAVVNKRPTPVRIQQKIAGGKITGYLEKPSTVDFDGTLRGGRSIVYEAKECRDPNRFPLSNIEEHQVDYLRKCHELGGISFILIEFTTYRAIYLIPYITLKSYWDKWKKDGSRGTASIRKEEMDVVAYEVIPGRVPVDYLSVVRRVWKLDDAA
jgi:recombination protein U